MKDRLTVGSLFSGIGGIDLGLERAGFHIAWQCEIDEWCRQLLGKRFPDAIRHGDIRTVSKNNLATVDILAGGFPCQDISPAGRRAGITGERSGLWSEFYRLVCELRPKYVIVENSADLLKRGFGRVLGDLARVGYDAEWRVLSAAQFGARHLRRRVFIIAYANRNQYDLASQSTVNTTPSVEASSEWICGTLSNTNCDRSQTRHQKHQLLLEPEKSRLEVFPSPIHSVIRWREVTKWSIWADEPSVGRVADGVPSRMDRLRGLGNAVVPQIAEYIGRCILASIEGESEGVA